MGGARGLSEPHPSADPPAPHPVATRCCCCRLPLLPRAAAAKALVRSLLVVDPAARLSAAAVLLNPWVAGGASSAPLGSVADQLKRFNARRRFRGGVRKIMATNVRRRAEAGGVGTLCCSHPPLPRRSDLCAPGADAPHRRRQRGRGEGGLGGQGGWWRGCREQQGGCCQLCTQCRWCWYRQKGLISLVVYSSVGCQFLRLYRYGGTSTTVRGTLAPKLRTSRHFLSDSVSGTTHTPNANSASFPFPMPARVSIIALIT